MERDTYRTGALRRWRQRQLVRSLAVPALMSAVLLALLAWAASELL